MESSATPRETGGKTSKRVQSFQKGEQDQARPTPSMSRTLRDDNGDNIEKKSVYSSLQGSGNARLLRLLPPDRNGCIQCKLFDYPIQETGGGAGLYEALSYVWGGSDKPHSISVEGVFFPVTANLHAALLYLRDQLMERILWVDAICINQDDPKERADQVQHMAEIYCKANRVVVWLGEAAADSDQALEMIRVAANKESMGSSHNEGKQQAILALLQREWFQRIWVLQEVAAARNILIMCGSTTIDGYTFCLGFQSLQLSYDALQDLRNRVRSVFYLIRGSIFRPKHVNSSSGGLSLGIRPLGELIDMYHTHRATERHDKVFALLGMSSDDLSAARLLPNYETSWEELFRRLVKFLLGEKVSVKTWTHLEMTVIKSKGCVLGQVSSEGDPDRDDRQRVVIMLKDTSGHMGPGKKWALQASAKPIRPGDLVCLLQGALNPVIIRPCQDHFSVIMITVTALGIDSGSIEQSEQLIASSTHEFLLVWDWETLTGNLQDQEYKTVIDSRLPGHSYREVGNYSDKMTRLWSVALILDDAEQYEKAEVRLQEIVKGYERDFGKEILLMLTSIENLALNYKKTKQWNKAEKLFEQVIQMRREGQGADHLDSTNSMASLASIHREEGRFDSLQKAEKLEAMTGILQGKYNHAKIIKEEVSRIAESFDEEVMQLLLDRRGDEVYITDSIVTAAAKNYQRGKEIIQLLLDQRGDEVYITDSVVTAAAGNSNSGGSVMQLLLDRKGDEVHITDSVVTAAAGNFYSGERVMQLLLDRKGDEVHITDSVVTAAARNSKSGGRVMQLLLDRKGDEVHITDSVVTAAAGNYYSGERVMQLLLDRKGDRVHITDSVVTAAAGNSKSGGRVMQLLLDRKGDEVHITDSVVTAAARNSKSGGRVMQLLLDRKGDEVHITDSVVTAAAGNYESGKEIIQLLLDRRGDEVYITDSVVTAAAGNYRRGEEIMQLLLDRRRDEVYITDSSYSSSGK